MDDFLNMMENTLQAIIELWQNHKISNQFSSQRKFLQNLPMLIVHGIWLTCKKGSSNYVTHLIGANPWANWIESAYTVQTQLATDAQTSSLCQPILDCLDFGQTYSF